MIIVYYIFPLLAFIPGSAILFWLSKKCRINVSLLEVIVFGSILWNYILVSFGYTIAVVSCSIKDFFNAFTLCGLLVLASLTYFVREIKNKIQIRLQIRDINLLIIGVILLLMVFAFVMSHGTFEEYDAIFYYLPQAKSIVKTGGLQYNYYTRSTLSTTATPAMQIIYAWYMYLTPDSITFDIGIRIIPFIYIILTALTVYLICGIVLQDSYSSAIGAISFISIPAIWAVSCSYSLYLDISFTFILSAVAYVILKLNNQCRDADFWWLVLGITISLMLLQKDLSYFMAGSLIALILRISLSLTKKPLQAVTSAALAALFVLPYNVFLVADLFNYPISLLGGYMIKQIPVFVTGIIFFTLSLREAWTNNSSCRVKCKRNLIAFLTPFSSVIVYFIRNLAVSGVPIPQLLYLSESYSAVEKIMSANAITPGALKGLPATVVDIFRWDTLFTAINLGGIFWFPSVIGFLLLVVHCLRGKLGKTSFIALSFFLMLLVSWSWIFNLRYTGPECRRLYYFAPFFAIFTAAGVKAIASAIKVRSILPRFIFFDCISLVYLWSFRMNLKSVEIPYVGITLRSLGIADFEMLMMFLLFFVISYYPFGRIFKLEAVVYNKFRQFTRLFAPLFSVFLLSVLILPVSFKRLNDMQDVIYYIPQNWQDGIYEVALYINNRIKDDSAIIANYGLHLSYFTDHPTIEITDTNGILYLQSVLSDVEEEFKNNLIKNNIRYLLLPNPGSTFYSYFENLSKKIPALSINVIKKTPDIVLVEDFPNFKLFKVLTQDELMCEYKYLTLFNDGWSPVGVNANLKLDDGLMINSLTHNPEVIIDDYQDMFWKADASSSEDKIILSLEERVKVSGNNSLKIEVDSMEWTAIKHFYNTSQDLSSFYELDLYLYGANTTKPIYITFHTVETRTWENFYQVCIMDDFVGWKSFKIPLQLCKIVGNPSWHKIDCIEIGFTGRTGTYYLDEIALAAPLVGVVGKLPPITSSLPDLYVVISVDSASITYPTFFELTSSKGDTVTQVLADGINLFSIRSELLRDGATIKLHYHQTTAEEILKLYYLGILNKTSK